MLNVIPRGSRLRGVERCDVTFLKPHMPYKVISDPAMSRIRSWSDRGGKKIVPRHDGLQRVQSCGLLLVNPSGTMRRGHAAVTTREEALAQGSL
jgi:hypothetical protein